MMNELLYLPYFLPPLVSDAVEHRWALGALTEYRTAGPPLHGVIWESCDLSGSEGKRPLRISHMKKEWRKR